MDNQIQRLSVSHGAGIAIVDLERVRPAAEKLVATLPQASLVMFIPTDLSYWSQMIALARRVMQDFGSIELVSANVNLVESHPSLNIDTTDDDGDLLHAREASKATNISIKGTLASAFDQCSPSRRLILLATALRLAVHHMKDNPLFFPHRSRGFHRTHHLDLRLLCCCRSGSIDRLETRHHQAAACISHHCIRAPDSIECGCSLCNTEHSDRCVRGAVSAMRLNKEYF